MAKTQTLILPISITSRVDVGRLLREVGTLEDFLQQAAIRNPGASAKLPKTSRLCDEFVTLNGLNTLHESDRRRMQEFLNELKTHAPLIHASFGVDPSPVFLQRFVEWIRKEIHPYALIRVGLQPNIGAGCVIRTTNKQFDFSIRQHFKRQRPLLLASLHDDKQQTADVPADTEVVTS